MKIILANPRGFCAGVNMAIECLERALEFFGAPVYVYHEIVHNNRVVDGFRRRGVIFVSEIDSVPEGSRQGGQSGNAASWPDRQGEVRSRAKARS